MTHLALFRHLPNFWQGTGINHENETFTATLKIEALVDSKAIKLDYVATRVDGKHLHRESGLLAIDHNGTLCLWPVMEELPFVLPHRALEVRVNFDVWSVTFATGEEGNAVSFQEEIAISKDSDGNLVYEHRWGMPGLRFGPKSACKFIATDGLFEVV